jgi:hypothetical protein
VLFKLNDTFGTGLIITLIVSATDDEDVSVTLKDTVIGFIGFIHPIVISDESVVEGVIEIDVGDTVHSNFEKLRVLGLVTR